MLVLILTFIISITLIPYVFSSVLKSVCSRPALSVLISLIFHLRQIRDSNKLSDFREDHNLTEDQGIPWHLLKHYNNNITRAK